MSAWVAASQVAGVTSVASSASWGVGVGLAFGAGRGGFLQNLDLRPCPSSMQRSQ